MIVQKPQFDSNSIRKGEAYWVSSTNRYNLLNCPCLIEEITPFMLIVTYYNTSEELMDTLKISIDDIVNKKLKLEKMKVEVHNG
jgi:hypothetical protein